MNGRRGSAGSAAMRWCRNDRRYLAARQREREGGNGLDEICRNGGRLVEDREQNSKDLLWEMGMARGHPDKLAADRAGMGGTDRGDDPYEHGELERNQA